MKICAVNPQHEAFFPQHDNLLYINFLHVMKKLIPALSLADTKRKNFPYPYIQFNLDKNKTFMLS